MIFFLGLLINLLLLIIVRSILFFLLLLHEPVLILIKSAPLVWIRKLEKVLLLVIRHKRIWKLCKWIVRSSYLRQELPILVVAPGKWSLLERIQFLVRLLKELIPKLVLELTLLSWFLRKVLLIKNWLLLLFFLWILLKFLHLRYRNLWKSNLR